MNSIQPKVLIKVFCTLVEKCVSWHFCDNLTYLQNGGVSKDNRRIRTSINKNKIQSEFLTDSCGNKKFLKFSENSELTNTRCKEDH